MASELRVFGIRHHGPGSARALLDALEKYQPDGLAIEGPADGAELLPAAAHEEMKPPVALLLYAVEAPRYGSYFPLCDFSPEWCALRWAFQHQVPATFIDLPMSHHFALDMEEEKKLAAAEQAIEPAAEPAPADLPPAAESALELQELVPLHLDPLGALARAAGFTDGERWWEHAVEHRRDLDADVFQAIHEAMTALREKPVAGGQSSVREPLREAWMRQTLRGLQRQHRRLAVVCGAWHAPVLTLDRLQHGKAEDAALLKGLPKTKTAGTWVPWTYERLTLWSGYGAGVQSPGWYEHLWQRRSAVIESWMTRIARLLRDQDLDCSSAHVIEATRLAHALAGLRHRPLPDLEDLHDATRAIFCFDTDKAMRLIGEELFVGRRLGEVPADLPAVPLQQDFMRQQQRLRLKPQASDQTLDLDLRKELDLERSCLLHRLRLLGIEWGEPRDRQIGKGTFHEIWLLRWDPACLVRLIELGRWGNTVAEAAEAWVKDQAARASGLAVLAKLLDDVMLADLPAAVAALLQRINDAAAVGADVVGLMAAFPPLANVLRYGSVRQFDAEMVRHAAEGLFTRLVAGLGPAVASLNDEAATAMVAHLAAVHAALPLLETPPLMADWEQALEGIADPPGVHGLVRGRAARLLFDAGRWSTETVATRVSLALSRGGDPAQGARWIEGFFQGSGLLLVHDPRLLAALDEWVAHIQSDVFNELTPLLRRTFATFAPAERKQLGARLAAGSSELPGAVSGTAASENLDFERARSVLPLLRIILGGQAAMGDNLP